MLFALAIPPLWAYTRRQLGPGAAYFVCVAYALSLPVMAAVVFDFHEVAFVPVLTAVMVERFDAGRRWHGVLAAAVHAAGQGGHGPARRGLRRAT